MKHWKNTILSAALLAVLTATPAHALEYTMEAPDDYLFGRPTSDDTIYEWEDPNVDRSKNVALIPPAFGSPTSYLPGSGTPLAPNLIPGALSGGGLVNSAGSVSYPDVEGGNDTAGTAFTQVTSDLYYSAGHLGTLKIPAIGLSTKVYQGTDSAALRKGVGISKIQVSGMETAALRHTTGAHGMTSRTCTRWNRAIPLHGPPSWGPELMKLFP